MEFPHESKYIRKNLTAENVFVSPEVEPVTLVECDFNYFKCTGGKHVAYKEGSRGPLEERLGVY